MVKKATRVSRFVSVVEDRSVYVGLDVHKKTYSVALFEPQDGLVETWICPAGKAELAAQLDGLGCRSDMRPNRSADLPLRATRRSVANSSGQHYDFRNGTGLCCSAFGVGFDPRSGSSHGRWAFTLKRIPFYRRYDLRHPIRRRVLHAVGFPGPCGLGPNPR